MDAVVIREKHRLHSPPVRGRGRSTGLRQPCPGFRRVAYGRMMDEPEEVVGPAEPCEADFGHVLMLLV